MTAVVSAWAPVDTSALTFTISPYPNYFVPAGSTTPVASNVNIYAGATSATTYTNLTPDNISGLAVGDVISIKGWYTPYYAVALVCKANAGCAPIGQIEVETVVGRPGPTPLF
jgi:hypothetical protein